MYKEKMSIFPLTKQQKEWRKRMIDADETGRYKKRTTSDVSKTENDLINKIIIVILFSIMFVGDIILMYLAYVK